MGVFSAVAGKVHGQQQLARDLEVERAVMGQRCRPQSFGEVHRCLYSSSTSNDRTEEMGTFLWLIDLCTQRQPIEPGSGRRVGYHFNTSYQKLRFGGRRRCGKGAIRLQAVLDAPRRNASCEIDRFEVAQGMNPTCTQNPWAITAVLLCTAVQQLFLFFRVHT